MSELEATLIVVLIGAIFYTFTILLLNWYFNKRRKVKADRFVKFQPNHDITATNNGTGDCAIRAFAKLFGLTWQSSYKILSKEAARQHCITSTGWMLHNILKKNGFKEVPIVNKWYKKGITFRQFAIDHPNGRYAVFSKGHMAAVIDGKIFDSWNSSNEKVTCAYIDVSRNKWLKIFKH